MARALAQPTLCQPSSAPQFDLTLSSTKTNEVRGIERLTWRQDCPHWNGEKQEATLCCKRESWRTDICRIVGYRYEEHKTITTGMDLISWQVELSPVFLEYLAVVHTEQVKQPSVTNAGPVACSHPPRSGESGTRRST